MILTVTINPLLEQRLTFEKVLHAGSNRNGKLKLTAGGKGINVSRQLNKLNIQNIALTFVGGTYGKLFRGSINDEGIEFSLINTHSETRICAVIIDSSKNNISYFFGENQSITKDETNKFIAKMEKMIRNCEMVIFSGSSPCKETDIIFPTGIEMANKLDKISICDTYGNHLENCYSASPRIVHNNIEEVTTSLHLNLITEKDGIEFLNSLYDKGIKQVFLTDGEKDYYSSNFDFHYKVRVPKIVSIDSTGSGDAFVAGITYGWHNNLVFEDQVKLATALGAANAKVFDVCNIPFDDASKIVESVEIHPIGKKIKIIDDRPD
ncbi:MAG: 1-phosphofructokinase family hexose kinase [Ignavibacteria bacterium]|nr:MAG: 1-phosphofructokinase family hexose kinase [Ignavibacteria bacterium]